MVKIALQISANLENLTALRTSEGEEFRWFFKFKCSSCGEVPDHWQHISLADSHPVKGGRGSANCVIKCKLCGRENSCDIIEDSVASYDFADSGKFKSVVVFDCRGMEPEDFSPRDGWTCKGFASAAEEDDDDDDDDDSGGQESGTVFEDVDLTDKEWADYDEKSNNSVCIAELKWQFVKIK